MTWTLAAVSGGVIFVLTPLYASRSLSHSSGLFGPLHGGAFRFSVLEVAVGVGALLGSMVTVKLAQTWPRARIFGVSVALLGLLVVCLALTENLYVAVLLLIGEGMCNSLYVIAGATLWQTLTPSGTRGRVLAARMTMINGALALGSVAGGFLLVAVPYHAVWILSGATIIVSSFFVWFQPEVRNQA